MCTDADNYNLKLLNTNKPKKEHDHGLHHNTCLEDYYSVLNVDIIVKYTLHGSIQQTIGHFRILQYCIVMWSGGNHSQVS
jgi:hypothetical protein